MINHSQVEESSAAWFHSRGRRRHFKNMNRAVSHYSYMDLVIVEDAATKPSREALYLMQKRKVSNCCKMSARGLTGQLRS